MNTANKIYLESSSEHASSNKIRRLSYNTRAGCFHSIMIPKRELLLRCSNHHTNVEVCDSIKTMLFLSKYVNKGWMRAMLKNSALPAPDPKWLKSEAASSMLRSLRAPETLQSDSLGPN
eukprot:6214840-Pleurochrysis_carterae.AAC.1